VGQSSTLKLTHLLAQCMCCVLSDYNQRVFLSAAFTVGSFSVVSGTDRIIIYSVDIVNIKVRIIYWIPFHLAR
jgi:hypothetical protein